MTVDTAAIQNADKEQIAIAAEQAARLAGSVWHDRNADELRDDAEAGIARATVELLRDLNGDGVITADEVFATTLTDDSGNYSFGNLAPGVQYQLRFSTPGGFDASASSQLSDPIVLQAGGSADVGIGFYKYATLGDRVWNDGNANGLQDAGETGRSGVTVELYTVRHGNVGGFATGGASAIALDIVMPGDLVATQLTDANGNYAFNQVAPGEYMLRFVAPDGTVLSSSNISTNDAADSDADVASGFTGVYTLASGEVNTSADAGVIPEKAALAADQAVACEDRSASFNVLDNDLGTGLKLVDVKHESTSLDSTFKSRGGALSFTADGQVTYKSMTNYYGYDRLVYTVEDAAGNRTTQTVDVTIKAVSDAPVGYDEKAQVLDFSNAQTVGDDTRWRDDIKMSDFGTFTDDADKRQTFGTYNNGVANDVDTAKYIRLYGLSTGASDAEVLYKGRELRFGSGKYYDIPVADIMAGKLEIDFSKRYYTYKLKFAWVDSGTVDNNACYDGSIVSNSDYVNLITSPIALDLSGDGKIGVTGATGSSQKDADATLGRTVQFDIDADGRLDTIEWFDGSGDGILVDNRDGLAASQMNGARLFGDVPGVYSDGYDKLSTLDLDGDGRLSGGELAGLVLWVDDGDAQVQAGELRTLGEMGVASISTQMTVTVDAEGRGHLQSTATRDDGSQVLSEDVYFAHGAQLPASGDVLDGGTAALDALVGTGGASTAAAASAQDIDVSEATEVLRRIAAALDMGASA